MLGLPWPRFSGTVRTGAGVRLAEFGSTAGLLLVMLRAPVGRAAPVVAAYIGAACRSTASTASTAFASPAAVAGRRSSDTFAGIAPGSAIGFVLAPCAGAVAGAAIDQALGPRQAEGGSA